MQSKELPPRDLFPEGDKIDVAYERAKDKIEEANELIDAIPRNQENLEAPAQDSSDS